MTDSITKVTAKCACGNFNYTINFPTSSLPISRALCLCNSCRKLSGSCGISYISIPPSQSFDPATWNLKTYVTSEAVARHFCRTCGAHIAVTVHRDSVGWWAIATGLWNRTEGIIKWTGCKFVEDTLDGGISVWFRDIVDASGSNKRELKRWLRQDRNNAEVPPKSLQQSVYPKGGAGKLNAECHCGGVKFHITRPNDASTKVQSPFSDLMAPYHLVSSENPNNETWWLRDNNTKYQAGICTCESCRLASGFEIQPWAFVPKCNILQEDGKKLLYDGLGTLQRYVSSKNTYREFCSVCGATVFWHNEERPNLVDVSVGLFDPEQGARVDSWLDWWTGRVSFKEMAVSHDLANSLEDGLKRWGSEAQS